MKWWQVEQTLRGNRVTDEIRGFINGKEVYYKDITHYFPTPLTREELKQIDRIEITRHNLHYTTTDIYGADEKGNVVYKGFRK